MEHARLDCLRSDCLTYDASVALRLRMSRQTQELLDREKCDVIAARWWTDTTAPVSGSPQVSVPLPAYPKGQAVERVAMDLITIGPNIPTSIIVGRRWDDYKVIAAALSLEKATQHGRILKPFIVATTELPQSQSLIS
ncbi:uncharacterized protein RAG0_01908 [Rhynchosporium agropyri]|uniref:Uncharacterized protein n=1 Tax=Rhynchosporium agropyri TaxID=914238 RepID=A0A1E1JZ57_9HELO|nr:uncharacterized protein RAG0_01908 [Rhynchosporium agropyri]